VCACACVCVCVYVCVRACACMFVCVCRGVSSVGTLRHTRVLLDGAVCLLLTAPSRGTARDTRRRVEAHWCVAVCLLTALPEGVVKQEAHIVYMYGTQVAVSLELAQVYIKLSGV